MDNELMFSTILRAICFSLPGIVFYLMVWFCKAYDMPINFFSGSSGMLKKTIDKENIKKYNKELSIPYIIFGTCFVISGVLSFVNFVASLVVFGLTIIPGIFILYVCYNKVYDKYRNNKK
ncbi:MAG: hypothetical protein MJ245_01735 [Clostridia bacterium]|nr:hypothetical protein [Clostridia bacterium]